MGDSGETLVRLDVRRIVDSSKLRPFVGGFFLLGFSLCGALLLFELVSNREETREEEGRRTEEKNRREEQRRRREEKNRGEEERRRAEREEREEGKKKEEG